MILLPKDGSNGKSLTIFWEWVEYAVKCMIEYNKEDGIE